MAKNTRKKPKEAPLRLPAAPLAEVVFELRWELVGPENTPAALKTDPGYPLLHALFSANSRRHGFTRHQQMHTEPSTISGGWSVGHRLYKGEDPFPIWQIGPGIFACNESTNYRWDLYKKLCLRGLDVLNRSYPESKAAPMRPAYLELRYVDIFDEDLLGHSDLKRFLKEDTTSTVNLENVIADNSFGPDLSGRIILRKEVAGEKHTRFILDIADGSNGGKRMIMATSKVVTSGSLSLPKEAGRRRDYISNWLDRAHNITSPFFQKFVAPTLMDKFAGRSANVG